MMKVSRICMVGHQGELPPLVGKERRPVGGAEPVDDRAHEAEQQDLAQRHTGAKQRHSDQPALGALAEMQAERDQPLGRLRRIIPRIGIETVLEPLEDAVHHCSTPTRLPPEQPLRPQPLLRSSDVLARWPCLLSI
jgi:hypothetical protein